MLSKSIVASVLEFSVKIPEKAAVIDAEGIHTYAELGTVVKKIACYFYEAGIKTGSL